MPGLVRPHGGGPLEPLTLAGEVLAAERVRMCAEMFESARRIVEASLPAGLAPEEKRYRICRRFYGDFADRAFGRR